MEPTLRIARIDLEPAELAAVSSTGFDKRLLAAGAAVLAVVGVVAIAVALRSSSGDVPATDAGVAGAAGVAGVAGATGVAGASDDAGAAVLAVDAGSPAAVVAVAEAGSDEADSDHPPVALGHPRPHNTADAHVEEAIRAVRQTMKTRGILSADVPAVDAQLERAHKENAHGNKGNADKLVHDAKASVDAVHVDRGFVMSKLTRFNKAYEKAKAKADVADKVDPLARQISASFAAGQYDQANQSLNRATAIILHAR